MGGIKFNPDGIIKVLENYKSKPINLSKTIILEYEKENGLVEDRRKVFNNFSTCKCWYFVWVNRMRIGKLQKQILKVMYDFERESITIRDEPDYILRYNGRFIKMLTAREIVERITGLKYPKEKDYGVNAQYRFNHLLEIMAGGSPKDKKLKEIIEKQEEWHKVSTSVYRAIKLLHKNKMIFKMDYIFKDCARTYLVITQKGRRIIAHRK